MTITEPAAPADAPVREELSQGGTTPALRGRPGRGASGLAPLSSLGHRAARRGRLPHGLRHLPVVGALRPALPQAPPSSSASPTTAPCSPTSTGGGRFWSPSSSPSSRWRWSWSLAWPSPWSCTAPWSAGAWSAPLILIPYGLVTVVAAYSWQYAWTPGTGYLANLLPSGSAPLTHTFQAIAIIVLAEVWKTTPFMALLLLAGLCPGLRRLAPGGPSGRRQRLAAVHQRHPAPHEAGHPGGAAVPDPGRLPHIRQHLHPHPGAEQDGLRVHPRPTTTCSPTSTWASDPPSRC